MMRVFLAIVLPSLVCALALSGCMTHVGIESPAGLLFDRTTGTMYINPEVMDSFSAKTLSKRRSYYAHKVVLPLPFTFGCLSAGWGDISTHEMMEEGGFKKLSYVQYNRLGMLFVYQHYEIVAHGE